MKNIFTLAFLFVTSISISQNTYDYAPSEKHPYGLPNPNAPQQMKEYAPSHW